MKHIIHVFLKKGSAAASPLLTPFSTSSFSNRSSLLVCLAVLILATACGSETPVPPAPTPLPTPTVLTVFLQPELDPLRPALAACAGMVPDSGALVFAAGASGRAVGPDEVLIQLGENLPEGAQAALLGYERIVVATWADAGLAIGTAPDLRALFATADGTEWTAWVPLAGTAMRAALDGVMDGAAYSPDAFLAPNAETTVTILDDDPAAVGVLPAAWLPRTLEAVYELAELPVLAVTDGVPEGRLRELIGCLQLNPVYTKE